MSSDCNEEDDSCYGVTDETMAFEKFLASREQASVTIANEILDHLGIAVHLESLEDCTPALWITLFEGLFETRLDGINRAPNAPEHEKERNVATVLQTLERRVLFQDLSHLSASDICAGTDIIQVMDLLEIFRMLLSLDVEGRQDGRGKLSEQWKGFLTDHSGELARGDNINASVERSWSTPAEGHCETLMSSPSYRRASPTTLASVHGGSLNGAEGADLTSDKLEDLGLGWSGDYETDGYFNEDTMPSTIHGNSDHEGSPIMPGGHTSSRNFSISYSTPSQQTMDELEQVIRRQREDAAAAQRASRETRQRCGYCSEDYKDIDNESEDLVRVPRRRVQWQRSKRVRSTPARSRNDTPKTPRILRHSPSDSPHTKALKIWRAKLLREARARDLLSEEVITKAQSLITVEALRLAALRGAPLTASRGFPGYGNFVQSLGHVRSTRKVGASRGGTSNGSAEHSNGDTLEGDGGHGELKINSSSGSSHVFDDDDIDLLPYVREVKATFPHLAASRFSVTTGRKAWRQTVDIRRRVQDRLARQLNVNENRAVAGLMSLKAELEAQLAKQEAARAHKWDRRKSEAAKLRTLKRLQESRNRRTVRLAKRQMDVYAEAAAAESRRGHKEEKIMSDLYHDMLKVQKSAARDLEKLRRDLRDEGQERKQRRREARYSYWKEQLRLVEDRLRQQAEDQAEAARAQEQLLRQLQNEQKAAAREAILLSKERLNADCMDVSHLERDAEDARRRARMIWRCRPSHVDKRDIPRGTRPASATSRYL